MTESVLIAGIGSPMRGDDAAGIAIAEALESRFKEPVRVLKWLGDPWTLLSMCDSVRLLILVDAAQATDAWQPGSARKLRYPQDADVLAKTTLRDLHSADIAHVLEMGAKLNVLPDDVWIYALAGSQFEVGSPITPEVRLGARALQLRVKADVRRYVARMKATGDEEREVRYA